MKSPTSALSSPLSSLGSRTPSPPPGFLDSFSPAAEKTTDTSCSPRTPSDITMVVSKAPKTIKKKPKRTKSTKRPLTDGKKSPAKSIQERAEVPTPEINVSTGLPSGYSAAKPTKLDFLLDERDAFAEYTSRVLDPNESLVMHGRLAKIQEEARKWNRGMRLQEAARDIKELANEVGIMDEEDLTVAEERIAALKKQIEQFEKKVAERKASTKKDGIIDEKDNLLKGKNAPEGKDIGSGGDDEDDMMEKGSLATGGAGQKGKKRKRGVN